LVLRPRELPTIPIGVALKRINENKGLIDGVVITGGEPTLSPSLTRICLALKREGYLVKLDTNGTNPFILWALLKRGLLDYVAMDVKAPLEEGAYSVACGVDAKRYLERIRESIDVIISSGVDHEFRTTIVPGIHKPEDVERIAQEIRGCRRYVIQGFKPLGPTIDPRYEEVEAMTEGELTVYAEHARKILDNVIIRV